MHKAEPTNWDQCCAQNLKKINQQNQDQKAPTKLEEAINTEPWQKHQ